MDPEIAEISPRYEQFYVNLRTRLIDLGEALLDEAHSRDDLLLKHAEIHVLITLLIDHAHEIDKARKYEQAVVQGVLDAIWDHTRDFSGYSLDKLGERVKQVLANTRETAWKAGAFKTFQAALLWLHGRGHTEAANVLKNMECPEFPGRTQ